MQECTQRRPRGYPHPFTLLVSTYDTTSDTRSERRKRPHRIEDDEGPTHKRRSSHDGQQHRNEDRQYRNEDRQYRDEDASKYYHGRREKRRTSGGGEEREEAVDTPRKRHRSSLDKEAPVISLLSEPPVRFLETSTPLPSSSRRGLLGTPPLRSMSFEHVRLPEDFNRTPPMGRRSTPRDSGTSLGSRGWGRGWTQKRRSGSEHHGTFPYTPPASDESRKTTDTGLLKYQSPTTPSHYNIEGPRGSRKYSIESPWRRNSGGQNPSPGYSGETPLRDLRYDLQPGLQERRVSGSGRYNGDFGESSNERGFQRSEGPPPGRYPNPSPHRQF